MANYKFVTVWRLRAPIDKVWDAIYQSEAWPAWWKGVVSVVPVIVGKENGIGGVSHFVWRSKLPYNLAFDMRLTRSEPPRRLEGSATGELEGTGVWDLSEAAGVTTARYTWSVRTTKAWMNLLGPIAKPAFDWNHDYVMANGARGIAKLLGAELLPS